MLPHLAQLPKYTLQERMMMSCLLQSQREEEERVTGKNSKQAESTVCTKNKNRTHLRTSSQFYNLQPHNYPHSQQDVNAPSLPGKFYLHRNSCRPFPMQGTLCYNAIHA